MQQEYEKDEQAIVVSFETLKRYGIKPFDKQDIFLLCSKRIREQEQAEDDFLLYLCYELVAEGYYDKALLQYMAQFYCGATDSMKLVWRRAKEYGVNTKALAERIITQMLFSETMYAEEEIIEDYYAGRPYFRLKQAYLAYVARMYVARGREISERMVRLMLQEYNQKEFLADICKVAILKYYVGRELEPALQRVLHEYFNEMCDKHMIFPFYLKYPQKWLKEVQLYDKVMICYSSESAGKVKVYYRIQREEDFSDTYHSEAMLPMYDQMYVKEFVLYEGETLQYYFEETSEDRQIVSERAIARKEAVVYEDGKYGRLNLISRLSKEKQYEAMLHYKKEELVAEELFPTF